MIKYKLKCRSSYCLDEKEFDGWFQNIEAYQKQKKEHLISCPVCGSDDVVKSLTTPNLRTSKNKNMAEINNKTNTIPTSSNNIVTNGEIKNISTILRTIKKEIEKNSTFVGDNFVHQAKSMKAGKIKQKPIHGHGTKEEIKELRDEGIDVVSVPWISDDH